jgi:hypothetical protein
MSGGECLASLEAEPTNPRDPLAVKVLMFGKIVGYLSREQAVEYGPAVALAVQHGEFITVRAHGRSWAGEFSEGDDLLLYLPTMKSLMRELQLAYSE